MHILLVCTHQENDAHQREQCFHAISRGEPFDRISHRSGKLHPHGDHQTPPTYAGTSTATTGNDYRRYVNKSEDKGDHMTQSRRDSFSAPEGTTKEFVTLVTEKPVDEEGVAP